MFDTDPNVHFSIKNLSRLLQPDCLYIYICWLKFNERPTDSNKHRVHLEFRTYLVQHHQSVFWIRFEMVSFAYLIFSVEKITKTKIGTATLNLSAQMIVHGGIIDVCIECVFICVMETVRVKTSQVIYIQCWNGHFCSAELITRFDLHEKRAFFFIKNIRGRLRLKHWLFSFQLRQYCWLPSLRFKLEHIFVWIILFDSIRFVFILWNVRQNTKYNFIDSYDFYLPPRSSLHRYHSHTVN